MARRKRPLTNLEIEQHTKAMKSGELRHFYKHNTMLGKKHRSAKSQPFASYTPKKRAKVIYRKKK